MVSYSTMPMKEQENSIVVQVPDAPPERTKRPWHHVEKKHEKIILKGLKEFRPMYLIAQDIGVSRYTLYKYVRDNMDINYKDFRESMLDIAENKLMANIIDGNQNAIQFFLDRQGKNRGYGERPQMDRQDVPTINIGTIQIQKPVEQKPAEVIDIGEI